MKAEMYDNSERVKIIKDWFKSGEKFMRQQYRSNEKHEGIKKIHNTNCLNDTSKATLILSFYTAQKIKCCI